MKQLTGLSLFLRALLLSFLFTLAAAQTLPETGDTPASTGEVVPHNALPAESPLDPNLPSDTGNDSSSQVALSGLTDNVIIFGQSAVLEGANAQIGLAAKIGILSAFREANQKGGVHGRQLRLISLDDGYNPERAIINTKHLVEVDGIFALMGATGTSPVRASAPVASSAGVPFIAPFTGDVKLRARWKNMIHLRASYDEETEAMIDYLVEDRKVSRIGVMYQNDYFGRDGYEGARLALARRQMEVASSGIYERNTTAIKSALLGLRQGDPEAVILIGAYPAVAELIRWSQFIGFNPIFIVISFVSSNALAEALGEAGKGVLVTQVVPFPTASDLPIAGSYLKALTAIAPEESPGFISFEGYLAGRLVVNILERCGRNLTRTAFLNAFRGADEIDLGGFHLYYGKDIDQGSNAVFLTIINAEGMYQPVGKLADAIQ